MLNHGPGNRPGPARRQPPHHAVADGEAHVTSTEETGSFALARCSCGWTGPARRARVRAREDAAGHTAG
ncbi:hypothetical protein G5C51_14795 [Streptomyces sp. A7024]|uniref:Uncharacterized protein n=1 Tax=Streptomyces coryli TaxID=1128680 RepID=A0A6G4U1Q0_9ACTN|nr:hypothetical protein [Streptomyces coryli]NGN65161.1 hypothetical protein [Streptomyces coryli]